VVLLHALGEPGATPRHSVASLLKRLVERSEIGEWCNVRCQHPCNDRANRQGDTDERGAPRKNSHPAGGCLSTGAVNPEDPGQDGDTRPHKKGNVRPTR
jgi:hypothetical protein